MTARVPPVLLLVLDDPLERVLALLRAGRAAGALHRVLGELPGAGAQGPELLLTEGPAAPAGAVELRLRALADLLRAPPELVTAEPARRPRSGTLQRKRRRRARMVTARRG